MIGPGAVLGEVADLCFFRPLAHNTKMIFGASANSQLRKPIQTAASDSVLSILKGRLGPG